MSKITRFLLLILAGLMSGALFVIWVGYDGHNLSAQAYMEQQQQAIHGLNTLMPTLGFITIVLTVICAFLQKMKRQQTAFILLLFAAVLLIISGLITRFGNQPINSIVMAWKPDNIPANWDSFRDQWYAFHLIRTFTTFLAFCMIIQASVRKD